MEELSVLQQAYYHLQRGAFSEAKEAFTKAIEAGEQNRSEAYIGVLLAEHGLRSEEQLIDIPERLSANPLFTKAKEEAKGARLAALEDYERRQRDVLTSKERQYAALIAECEKEHKTEKEIEDLISVTAGLRRYKDAPKIRAELEEELEGLREKARAEKKKKLSVILPVVIAACALVAVLATLFSFPKKDGVSYVLTLNGYSVSSVDKSVESFTVPEKINGIAVTSIGKKAFKDCKSLKTVTFNGKIRVIDEKAFANCGNLTEIIGEESVESVRKKAFDDCKMLSELHFSPRLNYAKTAFTDCVNLTVYAGDKQVEFDTNADK